MIKTKTLGVSVLGLGLIAGVALTFGLASQATNGVVLPVTAESLKAQLEQTAQNELAHGCVEKDSRGNAVFCGESKDKMDVLNGQVVAAIRAETVRSADQVAIVEENIRAVSENPSLNLRFDANVGNPYTEKIEHKIEYYKDSKDNMYMVDPASNKVVSFTLNTIFNVPTAQKLPIVALRGKADAYLLKNVEDFAQMKKVYKYEEGSKGDIYVFRYNAPSQVGEEEMLPFVQVKLSASGELVGFSDIRSLYK